MSHPGLNLVLGGFKRDWGECFWGKKLGLSECESLKLMFLINDVCEIKGQRFVFQSRNN